MPYSPAEAPFAVQSWHEGMQVWFLWSTRPTLEEAVQIFRGLRSERSRQFRLFNRVTQTVVPPCPFCLSWHAEPHDGSCLL